MSEALRSVAPRPPPCFARLRPLDCDGGYHRSPGAATRRLALESWSAAAVDACFALPVVYTTAAAVAAVSAKAAQNVRLRATLLAALVAALTANVTAPANAPNAPCRAGTGA